MSAGGFINNDKSYCFLSYFLCCVVAPARNSGSFTISAVGVGTTLVESETDRKRENGTKKGGEGEFLTLRN